MLSRFYKNIKYKSVSDVKLLIEGNAFHMGDISTPARLYGGGTDSLFKMQGSRGTGHFGSGVYLATYKNLNMPQRYDREIPSSDPPYVKIGGGLYLFDLDRYNLYKPIDKKHADVLYDMLMNINSMFYYYYFNDYKITDTLKRYYSKAKSQANLLNLSVDISFLKFARRYAQFYEKYQDNKPQNYTNPSLSTLFIEMNGYNGIDVSHIKEYDNETHGSVIYNINEYDTAKKESLYSDNENNTEKLNPTITNKALRHFTSQSFVNLPLKDVILLFKSLDEENLPTAGDLTEMFDEGRITENQYKMLVKLLNKRLQQLDSEEDY